MAHRKEQVESTLRRMISQVLARKISDPRIAGMVSVTHVEVSADRRHATVYVSVLPQRYEKRTIQGLTHAAARIYTLVCKEVAMRTVPHLDFRLDRSLKKQAEVLEAIDRARATDEAHRPDHDAEQASPGEAVSD